MVNGILMRTPGKSVRYAGELVDPEPLDAIRRHLPFHDSQWQFSSLNFARRSRPQLVSLSAGVQTQQ